ncbi:MAG: MurR/RpiR family transcriptional regulator [Microbacteriaceae bacterium]|nr:MurR/RpiR family transcriptional regulator [Microbacteriaceae bacterium]
MNGDVLMALEQAIPALRPAEQRIARFVLDAPDALGDSTITQLAKQCGTSPTTVARFVAALGFSGYPEFRFAISAAVGLEQGRRARFSVEERDVDPNDSVEQVVSKIAYQEVSAIEQTAKSLDLAVLDAVVEAIDTADRIDLFGIASSGVAAQDLQQKLHRIGLLSHCWLDPHLALTSAALLTPESVLIAFSHSGLTVETNDVLETARASGARTVAITNFPDSPLAEIADLTLTTAARETRFRSGAMSSRIAQLALVDILFVRIAQRRFDRLGANLERTHAAIQSHRLAPGKRPRG